MESIVEKLGIEYWIVIITALFCAMAVVSPVGALWLHFWSRRSLPSALTRIPGLSRLWAAIGGAPTYLLRDATVFFQTTLFQASIFLLDAATLWAMLRAIGQDVSFLLAFPSFIVASMSLRSARYRWDLAHSRRLASRC